MLKEPFRPVFPGFPPGPGDMRRSWGGLMPVKWPGGGLNGSFFRKRGVPRRAGQAQDVAVSCPAAWREKALRF